MSSLALQILPLIVSLLVAVSLHIAKGFFNEAKEVRPIVDFNALDSLRKLASFVLREMQDDVERCFYLATPPTALGEEYHARRRDEAANSIAMKIWDGAKKQKDLENIFDYWNVCEGVGRFICGVGTFLNLGVLVCLLAIIIFKPTEIVINNNYIWIALSLIELPILSAFICFLVAYTYKRKFHNIQDKLTSLTVQEKIDE